MSKQKNISETIKAAMRDSKLSLYAIGRGAGVNEDSLMRFLRGETSLRLDVADRLAEFLGVECRPTRRKGK